jgi:selenocysteine-specific elongation factor
MDDAGERSDSGAMLVATAGHIDHGKTSLIRALTGIETDRLPEERARGISIDLGFAYWRSPEGGVIGFVDVPGHERFVRNMLAGVGGIDFALLVVAADDGVMPQSIEHVQILDLLGVARGVVAITKCDRSPPERIEAVRGQVRALLAPTALAGAPVFEVSSASGAGVAELGAALWAASREPQPHRRADRLFRLAIDRAFSVTGAGVVVSGTVRDGEIATGARVMLSPLGVEARVRGLQSGGRPVERAGPGQRCAVNLVGVELGQIHRGDWLLAPELHAPTSRLEVRLRVLPTKADALSHDTPVHLHIGAADIEARVLIRGQGPVPPGGQTTAHLVLETPTHAATGDRFVLRDRSGRQSVGGGVVADPLPAARRRPAAEREPVSAALQASDPALALAALLAIPGHEVEARHFELCFALPANVAQALYQEAGAVQLAGPRPLLMSAARAAAVRSEMLQALSAFHPAHPDEGGMTHRALRAALATPVSPDVFGALLKTMTAEGALASAGPLLKLPGHTASLSPADDALWRRALPWLEERGPATFTPRDLASELRVSEVVAKALLARMRSNGEVWRVTAEGFLLRQQVSALAARAAVLAEANDGKGFTAAQYRDATGIGRNQVIRILEFFDAVGVTRRVGDVRKMRPDHERVTGA